MTEKTNYSLLPHNTFGIDERCAVFMEYSSTEEAVETAERIRRHDGRLLIIGSGSNLLLTQPFDGLVVHSAVKGIEQTDENTLRCGSGELFDDMIAFALSHNLYGAENLSLIPGEVGSSAVQNIGAYGAEAKDIISEVEAVEIATGQICTFKPEQLRYGYRDSRFKHEWKNLFLITHVSFRLATTFVAWLDYGNIRATLDKEGLSHPTATDVRQAIIGLRQSKLPDPKTLGNAGSFFMNPVVDRSKYDELTLAYPAMPHYTIDALHEKIPAGWLIEQCGWKGRKFGRAAVHDKQALVLVNLGQAEGKEIVELCNRVRHDVKQRFGIDLKPEVNIV